MIKNPDLNEKFLLKIIKNLLKLQELPRGLFVELGADSSFQQEDSPGLGGN